MSTHIISQNFEQPTGSPSSGEPVFLVIGKLRRPHGMRGEYLMTVLTDFPERIQPGITVYIGETRQPARLLSCRRHQDALLVGFEGMDNRDDAGVFRNQMVYVQVEDRPRLPEGEYYHHQIIGLRVITDSGEGLGTVIEIIETGTHDVCVIRQDSGKEILLPVIDSVVLSIDIKAGEMYVHLLPGILPE